MSGWDDSETRRYWHAHDAREAEWRSGFLAGAVCAIIGFGIAFWVVPWLG